MEVEKFIIQESEAKKWKFVLIAITKDGRAWMVGGEDFTARYLTPYKGKIDSEEKGSVLVNENYSKHIKFNEG